jgi:hypothetical protein
MLGGLMINKVEMTFKGAIVAWFEILFQHLHGGTEEITTHLSKRSIYPALNPGIHSANHLVAIFGAPGFKAVGLWAEYLGNTYLTTA